MKLTELNEESVSHDDKGYSLSFTMSSDSGSFYVNINNSITNVMKSSVNIYELMDDMDKETRLEIRDALFDIRFGNSEIVKETLSQLDEITNAYVTTIKAIMYKARQTMDQRMISIIEEVKNGN